MRLSTVFFKTRIFAIFYISSKLNKNYRFIKFDITKFYLNITKSNFIKVLKFAENFYSITGNDMNLIIYSPTTWLIHNYQTLENQLFNFSMESFNGQKSMI